MTRWQFNILFIVGVGGAVLLLIGPGLGLNISQQPSALTGIGSILAYVLTQKDRWTKKVDKKLKDPTKEEDDGV